MDQREAIVEVGKRIIPILQEFGVDSAVLMGYIRIDDKLDRFVACNLKKDDVAQVDGMRPVVHFATFWAAPDSLPPERLPSTPPDEKET